MWESFEELTGFSSDIYSMQLLSVVAMNKIQWDVSYVRALVTFYTTHSTLPGGGGGNMFGIKYLSQVKG